MANSSASHNEIRGTQSFVAVMGEVWHAPSLTGLEILYRWAWGIPLLTVLYTHGGAALLADPTQIPTQLNIALHGGYNLTLTPGEIAAAATLLLLWIAFSAVGRTILLRRLDPAASPRRFTLATLAFIRVAKFSVIVAAWFFCIYKLALPLWDDPRPLAVQSGVVGSFAICVLATLALFLFWALISWIYRLAAVLAVEENLGAIAAIRQAIRPTPLRAKLIELNLVMGIVKVALLVLLLVFSACPLPFSSVETTQFLTNWTIAVIVLYLITSDFFHAVRAAAYLRLYQQLRPNTPAA